MEEGKELRFYRSTQLTDKEIEYFKRGKGETIELLGFISTSKNIVTTKNFPGNAIIEIVVDDKTKRDPEFDFGYADLT